MKQSQCCVHGAGMPRHTVEVAPFPVNPIGPGKNMNGSQWGREIIVVLVMFIVLDETCSSLSSLTKNV